MLDAIFYTRTTKKQRGKMNNNQCVVGGKDCKDKDSMHYFMCHMTQKEFESLSRCGSKDYETGLSRDERYILNKIISDRIQNDR